MTKRLAGAAGAGGDPLTSGGTQRIAGPGELLQGVPYLLGFHPTRSVVLVGLRDGILVVTARIDLPAVDVDADADADPDADPGVGLDADRTPLPATLASMVAGGATEVIAVIYSDDAPDAVREAARDAVREAARERPRYVDRDEQPWARLAALLARIVDPLPCRLLEVLLVAGQRWWSFDCDSPGCCPPEGQAVPSVPSAFAARATVAGRMPLPDRAALAAVLDPLPEPELRALSPLLAQADRDGVDAMLGASARRHERSTKRALFAAARASGLARWQPPDDVDVARFAAALTVIPLRDAVWLAVDDRRLDGRPLWRDLARRVPPPFDAAPLFLFGWASWRAGDGALASIAGERAIAGNPDYSAADLLLAALSQGVDPRRFPRLSRSA